MLGFDANFPVQVTENVMYSKTDYITEFGSRLSLFLAFTAFVSQRILYPVFTKTLGNEIPVEDLELGVAKGANPKSVEKSTNDDTKRTKLVNKYLNWVTILKQMMKTDKHETEIQE